MAKTSSTASLTTQGREMMKATIGVAIFPVFNMVRYSNALHVTLQILLLPI